MDREPVIPTVSRVLILKTCKSDFTSYDGFQLPESGHVEAPDWDGGLPVCGGKLHGFLWGEGDGSFANWSDDAKWLVVSVDPKVLVEITEDGGGKHGFRDGEVVFCGDRLGATSFIAANGGHGRAIVGGTATAGYKGTASAGYKGTASAGHHGKASAGDYGTATAGDYGTATVGYNGTATAGYKGAATAGDYGKALSGDKGTASAGHGGTATVGDGGTIIIKWYDKAADRSRLAIGYIGEDGTEPNVPYRVTDGVLVQAE